MPRQIKGLKVPTQATLRKYGLGLQHWYALAHDCGYVCSVCHKLPPSKRLCVDHRHVKGFKHMPAHEKRKYVRGLLCSYCNHYLVGKNTITTIPGVVKYLEVTCLT